MNKKRHCFQIKLLKGVLVHLRVCVRAGEWEEVWRGLFWTTGHFMPWSAHVLSKHCLVVVMFGGGGVLTQEGISEKRREEREWINGQNEASVQDLFKICLNVIDDTQ